MMMQTLDKRTQILLIDELRGNMPLNALLKMANLPRSTYYYRRKNLDRPDKYRELREMIQNIFEAHRGWYGYRRITAELHNRKIIVNHKLVLRLMREMGLSAKRMKKKYRSYKGDIGKTAPNLIERDFSADIPNSKWVTDVTEFKIPAGKVYLSPILDLFNGEIVSFDVSWRADLGQVIRMVKRAALKLPDHADVVLHSDQGWQYQTPSYQNLLSFYHIRQSMSRKGNCLDNAVIENFFGTLKREMFFGNEASFRSRQELIDAIRAYIEYYNHRRLKQQLHMPPVAYRLLFEKNARLQSS